MIAFVFFIYYISPTRSARRTKPNMHRRNTMNKDERQASIRRGNSPRAGASLFTKCGTTLMTELPAEGWQSGFSQRARLQASRKTNEDFCEKVDATAQVSGDISIVPE